jgi:hypothetical protein
MTSRMAVATLLFFAAACAGIFSSPSAEAERQHWQEQEAILDAAYSRATASGSAEDAIDFSTQVQIRFPVQRLRDPRSEDARARLAGYLEKGIALLDERARQHPTQAAQLMLAKADLLDAGTRWAAAVIAVRDALDRPGVDERRAFSRWTAIGREQARPDVVLDACRRLGPRLPAYEYVAFLVCVRDGASGDQRVGLAWAKPEDRERFRTEHAEQERQTGEAIRQTAEESEREGARDECRNACIEDHERCVNSGVAPNASACLDDRDACLARCERVIRFSRER